MTTAFHTPLPANIDDPDEIEARLATLDAGIVAKGGDITLTQAAIDEARTVYPTLKGRLDAITATASSGVSQAVAAQTDADEALVLVGSLLGDANASDQTLRAWAKSESYEIIAATYNANGVMTTGTVLWPDGSAGTFTSDVINATWLVIDAYTITHVASGQVVEQPTMTRNANGAITIKPALIAG